MHHPVQTLDGTADFGDPKGHSQPNGLILDLADTVRLQQPQSPASGFQVVRCPGAEAGLSGAYGGVVRRALALFIDGANREVRSYFFSIETPSPTMITSSFSCCCCW